ncbi:MAG: polysaccharide deacetylase family protein [Deltaproteobacteria bacterium]|nr:polysaccharide deacetylase family protein [Deltaproteobacteria bacterium]MBW1717939.1 polysaccharide deacetylase family protein [Deltaproteobacteria bacterium]MBW1931630.1 polysaccharide deacetylase family protein [Deltaproteobacteria bacterium]MBW1937445.1 polysaccharide deacetylase family protein [Deltaproteobacteria bacterium]MBW1964190.1 polysaccharide deacetylase family protein [Deltaproteobacteria bacterium]
MLKSTGILSKSALKGLILLGGTGALTAGAYEIFCSRATLWGRVLTHGSRNVPAISLVFDQSPNPLTEPICKRLHELEIPATFFIEGEKAKSNPRAMRSLQSFEIGIHGETYRSLIFQNKMELRHMLKPCLTLANDIQGRDACFLMPPHGWKDLRLIRTARELGLFVVNPSLKLSWREGVLFNTSVERILTYVGPGDIILVKNDPLRSPPEPLFIELLTLLIIGLKDKGLRIWGLSPLLRLH